MERFSDCLRQLFRSIRSEESAELGPAAAVSGGFKPPVPAAVSSEFVNSPAVRGADQQTFSMVTTSNVVLAIDIEIGGDGLHFPDKGEHPVFQIGCIVGRVGCDQPISQTVFTSKPTAAIAGVDVVVAEDEVAMLAFFSSFVIRIDPDVITGFNVCAFDLKYLIERMQKLRLNSALCIGRTEGSPMRFSWKEATDKVFRFKDGSYGRGAEVCIPGRVVHCMYQLITSQYELVAKVGKKYSLANCSFHFLNDTKGDLEWQQIVPMFNGTDADRKALAVYCLKDAQLALRLMNLLSKQSPDVKRFFEVANPLAQTIASVPTVSGASTNVATGPPISSASSLPPAVLARIEANKQAALQKRKAAEDAANAQRLNESVAISANGARVTLPHDSGRPPSVNVLPPSLEQSGANQTKRTLKRHWGALGAVSDDGDD